MITPYVLETILLWSIYILVVCLVFSIYEFGILLGTKIIGGQYLACECGFGPLIVECTIRQVQYRIRLFPIVIGITISIHDRRTNRSIVRRPLIVQLRRRYGVDLGALSGIAKITPREGHRGSLLFVLCVATTTLLIITSMGAFADTLLVFLSRLGGPLTCCAAGKLLAAGSMLCGASVVVASYNLIPIRRFNDGGLLMEAISSKIALTDNFQVERSSTNRGRRLTMGTN